MRKKLGYGFISVVVLPGVTQSVCSVTPLWPHRSIDFALR